MLSLGLPPLHVAPFFLYKVSAIKEPNQFFDDNSIMLFILTFFFS